MTNLTSLVKYFQQKLGNYDKQSCDQSVEQRILQDMDKNTPGQDKKDSHFLIDIDLVRGSVFPKSKTRHRWIQVVLWGVLRTAFAPIYWDYWCEHTSCRMAAYIVFHFLIQFLQAVCFLLIDPEMSKSTQDDVFVPCLLAVSLGILHAHITATYGSISGSVSKSSDKQCNPLTSLFTSRIESDSRSHPQPQSHQQHTRQHGPNQEQVCAVQHRETDPQSNRSSDQLSNIRSHDRPSTNESGFVPAIEHQDSSPNRTVLRHRRSNLPHTSLEPGGVSSDADEEGAEDDADNECGGGLLPGGLESGPIERHTVPRSRGAVRLRTGATTRSKAYALRLKTATCLHDSERTSGEDEDEMSAVARELEEAQAEPNFEGQSQSLDEAAFQAGVHSSLFRTDRWHSASATSLFSPTRGHEADGEESETEPSGGQISRSGIILPNAKGNKPCSSEAHSQISNSAHWLTNIFCPLSISTEDHSAVVSCSGSGKPNMQPAPQLSTDNPTKQLSRPTLPKTNSVTVDAVNMETITPLNELALSSALPRQQVFNWDPTTGSSNHFPLESKASTELCIKSKESESTVRRPRFRSWSIGFPVDQHQTSVTPSSLVPFCCGSSLGLSHTTLSFLSDEQLRCCFVGIGSFSRMINATRNQSSPNNKPLTLGWDPIGRDFSSMQALRTSTSPCTRMTNSGGPQAPRHNRRGRASVSDLSSAQSTSSTGSQPEQNNDRSGLHRDLESVHEVGAELCANPKPSSWNGNVEDLAQTKSNLLLVDTKPELGKADQTHTVTNHNCALVETASYLDKDSKRKSFLDTEKMLSPEQDEREKSDSCHDLRDNKDLLSMSCVGNEDTFTARCRQRANFLQLFLRRAQTYRQQARAPATAQFSSEALDKSGSRAHRSNQLVTGVTHNGGPVPRSSDSMGRKEEHIRFEPGLRRRISSGLRSALLVASQSKAQINSHGTSVTGLMYNRGTCYPVDRKISFGTRGQTASETEYDRINSDVGSDVDSSSGPEEIAEQPTPVVTRDPAAPVTDCRTPLGSNSAEQGTTAQRSYGATPPQSPSGGTVPGPGQSRSSRTGAYFRDASNAWSREPPCVAPLPESPSNWSHESDDADRLRSNVVELAPDTLGPVGRGTGEVPPEVLFENHITSGTKPDRGERLAEKYTYPHPGREVASNAWAHLSTGANDTIACYVWEGDKPAKCNLTMLDVGWNVIRAVERQGVSSDYILLACVSSIILPLLSVFYHWNRSNPADGNATNGDNGNITSHGTPSALNVDQRLWTETHMNESDLTVWLGSGHLADSLIVMQLQVLIRLGTKLLTLFGQPFHWLLLLFGIPCSSNEPLPMSVVFWNLFTGQWIKKWLMSPDLPGKMVIFLGVVLRFNVFSTIFLLLCIAERTFQQRLLYAKYFFSLTSGRRARKYRVPQFRLNKLRHIKCWLTLRSYLKKRGPQRSVENIIVASFYVVFVFGLALGSQFISRKSEQTFSRLINLDMMGLTLGIALFQHRFLILGTKITKKYRNLSIIITEQINLYLSIEKKPYKKDDLLSTFQVLRLVEGLLKEVDGPFRICGWTVNPLVYNVFKLVLLSCFSTILSDAIGFKLKLHKLKLNAANW